MKEKIYSQLKKVPNSFIQQVYADIQTAKQCRMKIQSYDNDSDADHVYLEMKLQKCNDVLAQYYKIAGIAIPRHNNTFLQYELLLPYCNIVEEYYYSFVEKVGD